MRRRYLVLVHVSDKESEGIARIQPMAETRSAAISSVRRHLKRKGLRIRRIVTARLIPVTIQH